MKTVLFFYRGQISPERGGIAKITHTLAKTFTENGYRVFFMGITKDLNKPNLDNQYYIPSSDFSRSLNFMVDFCKRNKIDFIINQAAMNPEVVSFLYEVKKLAKDMTIISCVHNCTITPIKNYAYQKEYGLRKRYQPWLFYMLKNTLVNNLMQYIYIVKYRKQYLELIDKSDIVTVLCDGLKDELLKMVGLHDCNKLLVIPNCMPPMSKYSYLEKKNQILWVAEMSISTKRPDILLNAWEMILKDFPTWEVHMLGDGADLLEMKDLVKCKKIKRVYFEGRVKTDEFYKESKIVCITSTHESFSLTTLEGLYYGCVPIVINSFPAAKMLIQRGKNGILVDDFKAKSLAKALSSLISDDTNLKSMALKSIESSERFSPDRIFNNYWLPLLSV